MSAAASSSSASARAIELAERQRRECVEWVESREGAPLTRNPGELAAALAAYRAGWFAGLGAGVDISETAVEVVLEREL